MIGSGLALAGSAGLAAENYSVEDLKQIEEALLEMKNDKGNGEEADLKFHLAIANATHNEILINLIKSVSDAMVLSMWEIRKLLYDSEEKMASLFEAHQLIFVAIKIKDVNLATEQKHHHLTVTEKVQFEYRDE